MAQESAIYEYQLIPDVRLEPFFKTELVYQDFRDRFCKSMKLALDNQRIARALSEHEFIFRGGL